MKEISINRVIACLAKDVPGTLEGWVEVQEGQGPRSSTQAGGLAMETRKSASPPNHKERRALKSPESFQKSEVETHDPAIPILSVYP